MPSLNGLGAILLMSGGFCGMATIIGISVLFTVFVLLAIGLSGAFDA